MPQDLESRHRDCTAQNSGFGPKVVMAKGGNLVQSEDRIETGTCWTAASSFNLRPSVTHFKCWPPTPSWTIFQIWLNAVRWVKPSVLTAIFSSITGLESPELSPGFSLQTDPRVPVPSHKDPMPSQVSPVPKSRFSATASYSQAQLQPYQAESMSFISSQRCLRKITAEPIPSPVERVAQKAQPMRHQELEG